MFPCFSYELCLCICNIIGKHLCIWLYISFLYLPLFLGATTLSAAKNKSRCGETNAQKIWACCALSTLQKTAFSLWWLHGPGLVSNQGKQTWVWLRKKKKGLFILKITSKLRPWMKINWLLICLLQGVFFFPNCLSFFVPTYSQDTRDFSQRSFHVCDQHPDAATESV